MPLLSLEHVTQRFDGLVAVVLIPMCAAANSSSRIAIHARPKRLVRRLFANHTASAIKTRISK